MLEDDDDDDEIEALDNEGVGDELEDDDEVRILHFLLKSHVSQSKTNVKVMPAESNDNEPGVVNAESTREEVLNNCIGIIWCFAHDSPCALRIIILNPCAS